MTSLNRFWRVWNRDKPEAGSTGDASTNSLSHEELGAMRRRGRSGKLATGNRPPTGARIGKRQAPGSEHDSTSAYVSGDDIRRINWRATARRGQLQSKRFLPDARLAQIIVTDLDPILFFGTSGRLMAKTGALAAARLAWNADEIDEPVGLICAPSGTIVPPRRGPSQLKQIMEALVQAYARPHRSADSDVSLAEAVTLASSFLGKDDRLFVISDFGQIKSNLSNAIADCRETVRTCAVQVDDPMIDRAVPPGIYPLKSASRGQCNAHIPGYGAKEQEQLLNERRIERRSELGAVFDRIMPAIDLVPAVDEAGS